MEKYLKLQNNQITYYYKCLSNSTSTTDCFATFQSTPNAQIFLTKPVGNIIDCSSGNTTVAPICSINISDAKQNSQLLCTTTEGYLYAKWSGTNTSTFYQYKITQGSTTISNWSQPITDTTIAHRLPVGTYTLSIRDANNLNCVSSVDGVSISANNCVTTTQPITINPTLGNLRSITSYCNDNIPVVLADSDVLVEFKIEQNNAINNNWVTGVAYGSTFSGQTYTYRYIFPSNSGGTYTISARKYGTLSPILTTTVTCGTVTTTTQAVSGDFNVSSINAQCGGNVLVLVGRGEGASEFKLDGNGYTDNAWKSASDYISNVNGVVYNKRFVFGNVANGTYTGYYRNTGTTTPVLTTSIVCNGGAVTTQTTTIQPTCTITITNVRRYADVPTDYQVLTTVSSAGIGPYNVFIYQVGGGLISQTGVPIPINVDSQNNYFRISLDPSAVSGQYRVVVKATNAVCQAEYIFTHDNSASALTAIGFSCSENTLIGLANSTTNVEFKLEGTNWFDNAWKPSSVFDSTINGINYNRRFVFNNVPQSLYTLTVRRADLTTQTLTLGNINCGATTTTTQACIMTVVNVRQDASSKNVWYININSNNINSVPYTWKIRSSNGTIVNADTRNWTPDANHEIPVDFLGNPAGDYSVEFTSVNTSCFVSVPINHTGLSTTTTTTTSTTTTTTMPTTIPVTSAPAVTVGAANLDLFFTNTVQGYTGTYDFTFYVKLVEPGITERNQSAFCGSNNARFIGQKSIPGAYVVAALGKSLSGANAPEIRFYRFGISLARFRNDYGPNTTANKNTIRFNVYGTKASTNPSEQSIGVTINRNKTSGIEATTPVNNVDFKTNNGAALNPDSYQGQNLWIPKATDTVLFGVLVNLITGEVTINTNNAPFAENL